LYSPAAMMKCALSPNSGLGDYIKLKLISSFSSSRSKNQTINLNVNGVSKLSHEISGTGKKGKNT
jgi:hypothetical protein